MSPQPPFTDVPDSIEEIRAGRMIIVVDDEDRENEGDLTVAAARPHQRRSYSVRPTPAVGFILGARATRK